MAPTTAGGGRRRPSVPLRITLLGRPAAHRDGVPVAPVRGRKAWALLAYLAGASRPVSRDQLVSLLFAEADDPFGALRWNLSALRRSLGPIVSAHSTVVELTPPPGTTIDVRTVLDGSWQDAIAVETLDHELLEGMAFDGCPGLELWLAGERRRVAAAAESALHAAALELLAGGAPARATEVATRLVVRAPLDENAHILLVRALAAGGDGVAAARQVAACRRIFAQELGAAPGPALEAALASAAAATPGAASTSARLGRPAIQALLESGRAAIAAGVLDPGLETVRRAVDEARAGGPGLTDLRADALVELGRALVHAARGRDEEGAAALHEALALAADGPRAGGVRPAPAALVTAQRELGYVEFLRGRYVHAERWLHDAGARARAIGDRGQEAQVQTTLGSVATDRAAYGDALEQLTAAVAGTTAVGDDRAAAYASSMLGRAHLLRGDLDPARAALDVALATAARVGWLAFLPWPESWRAAVDLASGDVDAAAERYDHAFAVGCQIGDPCWEGVSGCGVGLVLAARGRDGDALAVLEDASVRCVRAPDGYLWGKAYVLDALCRVALRADRPAAHRWVDELHDLAARTGMRELLARALLHRAALGDEGALVAAATVAADVDNPVLATLVAEAGG